MSISLNTTHLAVLKTLVVCLLGTAVFQPLLLWMQPTNIAMLFMLVVLGCSWAWGKTAGIVSACISVAAFDFFFVAPRFSFSVSDVQYLITFAVMLIVAISISYLLSTVRQKQAQAEQHARQTAALYTLATDLMKALQLDDIIAISSTFIQAYPQQRLGYQAFFLLPDPHAAASQQQLIAYHFATVSMVEQLAAQTLFNDQTQHGEGQVTHDGDAYTLYVLLQGATRTRGVLLIRTLAAAHTLHSDTPFLEAVGSIIAIAIERLHYIEVAHQTEQQIATERLRSSILSALSHDIRTPLTAMYGLADSLHWLDTTQHVAVLETADRLCEQALQLNQMVSNLLELSKLQTGKITLKREWIPLEEMIGSSLYALAGALRGVNVQVDIPGDMLLHVDPVLFERVLANLLDNAIKYNKPSQGINSIYISAQPATDTNNSTQIMVFNPAQPLHPSQLASMFTQFERLSHEHGQAGTGVGLSIANTIVQAHGGKIAATMQLRPSEDPLSEGVEGVAMTIYLPFERPPRFDVLDIENQHAQQSASIQYEHAMGGDAHE